MIRRLLGTSDKSRNSAYRKVADRALEILDKIAITVDPTDRESLKKVAMTSMASKLVSENKEQLADIAVDAILHVARKVGEEYRVDLDDARAPLRSV